MKIRLERDGVTFEYTHPPLPEARFKAILGLAASVVYVGLVLGAAALCGFQGLVAVVVATAVVAVFHAASF